MSSPIQNLENYFSDAMPPTDVACCLRGAFVQLSMMMAKYSPESGQISYMINMEETLYTLNELANIIDPPNRKCQA